MVNKTDPTLVVIELLFQCGNRKKKEKYMCIYKAGYNLPNEKKEDIEIE